MIHSHNYTCMQQFRRNFDLGVSQAEYPEVFQTASSESEGIRLVKKTFRYLCMNGRRRLIPGLYSRVVLNMPDIWRGRITAGCLPGWYGGAA